MEVWFTAAGVVIALAALVVSVWVARRQTRIQERLAAIEEARRAEEVEARSRAQVTASIDREGPRTLLVLHNAGPALAGQVAMEVASLDGHRPPPTVNGREVLPIDVQPGQALRFGLPVTLTDPVAFPGHGVVDGRGRPACGAVRAPALLAGGRWWRGRLPPQGAGSQIVDLGGCGRVPAHAARLLFGYLAWQRWGPLAGIVVGFVFAGGLGWRLLGVLVTMLRLAMRPRRTRQMRPFTEAWEARFGEIGEDPRSQPPPGVFPAWYRAYRKTGVSAGDWLDAQVRRDRT